MCEPKFFDVGYVINPHMEGNIGNVDRALALKQWNNLRSIISNLANVEVIDQAPGLPDMVFTANAGLVFKDLGYVWLSRFAVSQRRGEQRQFAGWFISQGLDIIETPPVAEMFFEGAGDGLIDLNGEYWLGYGIRSTRSAVETITKFFHNRKFHSLELKDPHFYHLDTCFAPLSKGHFLWYPRAFATPSYWYVACRNGRNTGVIFEDNPIAPLPDMLVDVDESDAMAFACNAVNIDDTVILPMCSSHLVGRLEELGYEVITIDLSEFIKAGGAAKCLTLQVR